MQVIKNNKSLADAIDELELRQKNQEIMLKEHFFDTVHSLNPLNIIKEKFTDTISSPNIAGDLIRSTAGMATGLISRSYIKGPSGFILGKILSSVVRNNIGRLPIPDPAEIKNTGISFLQKSLLKMKID